jgi:hypothetical protein
MCNCPTYSWPGKLFSNVEIADGLDADMRLLLRPFALYACQATPNHHLQFAHLFSLTPFPPVIHKGIYRFYDASGRRVDPRYGHG